MSSALYVFSEALVIVVQGEEYRGAIALLRVLCWSVALTYGRIAADASLTTGDRMRVKLLVEMCATFLVFLSSLLLVEKYGAMAASGIRLLGDFSLLALMITYAYFRRLYPFPGLLGISVPSVITILAAITFTRSMPNQYLLAPLLFLISSILIWSFFLRFFVTHKEV